MINGFGAVAKAIDEGRYWLSYLYKPTAPAPGTTGFFIDCNQSSGIPKYNAFAGSALTATVLTGSGNAGIYTGPDYAGRTKHLQSWNFLSYGTNGAPSHAFLLDYLMFYPLIDGDDTAEQTLDNTNTLTRYSSGEGVRIILVSTAPMTLSALCTITYTNSEGVSGRAVTFAVGAGLNIGVSLSTAGTSGAAGTETPFVPLASGDHGVRSIESIQLAAATGGIICAILVKPIADIMSYEVQSSTEKIYGIDNQNLPEIKQGAYLNLLIKRGNGSTNTTAVRSDFVFVNT